MRDAESHWLLIQARMSASGASISAGPLPAGRFDGHRTPDAGNTHGADVSATRRRAHRITRF
ncbi:hypothetical protein C6Q17_02240 [Burkholderia contaminans]|nr:hypothetical protein C6Q17_02240 [Burkholderia contaminans]